MPKGEVARGQGPRLGGHRWPSVTGWGQAGPGAGVLEGPAVGSPRLIPGLPPPLAPTLRPSLAGRA